MTTIEGNKVLLNHPSDIIISFLSDFNNYERIMPDQVSEWESTTTNCRFTIKGMPGIGMKFKDATEENKSILIGPDGKVPFDFNLRWNLIDIEGNTEASLTFEADLNAFYKMMLVGPLTNFINMLSENLKGQEI